MRALLGLVIVGCLALEIACNPGCAEIDGVSVEEKFLKAGICSYYSSDASPFTLPNLHPSFDINAFRMDVYMITGSCKDGSGNILELEGVFKLGINLAGDMRMGLFVEESNGDSLAMKWYNTHYTPSPWKPLAISLVKNDNLLQLYINGEMEWSKRVPDTIQTTFYGGIKLLEGLDASLDYFRVWDSAHTEEQIRRWLNPHQTHMRKEKGLIHKFTIDEDCPEYAETILFSDNHNRDTYITAHNVYSCNSSNGDYTSTYWWVNDWRDVLPGPRGDPGAMPVVEEVVDDSPRHIMGIRFDFNGLALVHAPEVGGCDYNACDGFCEC